MKLLDLTLPTPSENLALDEALLDVAESGDGNVLRLWESAQTAVIIGRASRIDLEVDRDYCDANGIPVLRRCSGGAAVVIGPGCLMYSVLYGTQSRPEFGNVDRIHRFVLGRIHDGLRALGLPVDVSGTSDLALNQRKFSGNSLRVKRNAFLYHGTLLYGAPIGLIERCLRMPPREPGYRRKRSHGRFLTNLPTPAAALRDSLTQVWDCRDQVTTWPREETLRLARERYGRDTWNAQR